MRNFLLPAVLAGALFVGCGTQEHTPSEPSVSLADTNGYDIRTMRIEHPSAYIPSMCYTKTEDATSAHNPCYVCHTRNRVPNPVLEDEQLQTSYDFPAPALRNPFVNLFEDFRWDIDRISDDAIDRYVAQSNYFDANGSIVLQRKLEHLPKLWDTDADGQWSGYRPDCRYRFDAMGFDRDREGNPTGWVAFAYMPFPGTFWPTNGSTDDVLIRLPKAFQTLDKHSEFNATVYRTNLAIVEALIKRQDVALSPAVDETALGVDLDRDGRLALARSVVFDWDPKAGRQMTYVGAAGKLLAAGDVHLAAGLFPEGTEFLHSVRYIQTDDNGSITLAPRMKELRYAKKVFWLSYADLKNKAYAMLKEKDTDPDRLETFRGTMERGLGNGLGWIYQGFIEDRHGQLRPQSYEETLNCMGCHSGIAALTDSTFVFARKLEGWRNGWYHWSDRSIAGVPERRYGDGTGEYTEYLRRNHAGDEFRSNEEVIQRFFLPDGELNATRIARLHDDVSTLIFPSSKRARALNKAYRVVVQKQRFIDGRAAHGAPLVNVHRRLEEAQSTGNTAYLIP